jgi:hypothetical protein
VTPLEGAAHAGAAAQKAYPRRSLGGVCMIALADDVEMDVEISAHSSHPTLLYG